MFSSSFKNAFKEVRELSSAEVTDGEVSRVKTNTPGVSDEEAIQIARDVRKLRNGICNNISPNQLVALFKETGFTM